jgi:hypothetical protein
MTRLETFTEYFVAEDLRPNTESNRLSFKFEKDDIYVDIREDDDFIVFSTEINVSFFDDPSIIAEVLNLIVRFNRFLIGWHDAETLYLAVGIFAREPAGLRPYLYEILYSLVEASSDLEISANDAPFFFEQIVNESYAGRTTGTESALAISSHGNPDDRDSREALLMSPSSETTNKLRWESENDGVTFSLYIPKRRVPIPWPRQIVVAVCSYELKTEIPQGDLRASNPIDRRLPIIVVLELEARRKHTARYRPIGNAETWEVGKPYIPYSLLRSDLPARIQLEVRWDFSAGTWSE